MYHVDWDDFDLPLDKLQVQQHIHKVAFLAYVPTSLYGKYTRLLSGIEKNDLYLVADKHITIFDTSDKISSINFTSQNVSNINIQFFYNSLKSEQEKNNFLANQEVNMQQKYCTEIQPVKIDK